MATTNFSNSTEAAKAGLNLTLEPVEKFIFAGLQSKVLRLFEAKSVWVTSNDKVKALQQLFGQPSQEASEINVVYPYVFLALTSLAEATDRSNVNVAASRGLPNVVPASDGRRSFRLSYIPVDMSVTVEYITNNYADVIKFSKLWLFARHKGGLNFSVTYGRSSFSVSVRPDSTVQIPPRESELEGTGEYTVTQTLTIHGYLSESTLVEQQVTTSLEADFALNAGTVFWSTQSPETDLSPAPDGTSVSRSTP